MAQFIPAIQFSTASGTPYNGGLMTVYQAGTTTKLDLYSNEAMTTPATNPLVADAAGVFPPAFLDATRCTTIVTQSDGTSGMLTSPLAYTIGQADNISAENVSYDGTALGFSSTNLQDAIAELASSFVLAPPTTVDNTVPRFNGANGQLQTTGIVVADTTNDVSGIGQITQTTTGANKIPNGTTAQRPTPATAMHRYNSTLGVVEFYNGTAWVPVLPVSGTVQATTSGTSKDFTSIPAWAKKITISVSGLSTNGSSAPMIQIGDSGGIEATGYAGNCFGFNGGGGTTDYSTGFMLITNVAAGDILHGHAVLTLIDPATFTWVFSATTALSADTVAGGSGSKSLTAALDRLRLTMVNGTDTFDAGKVNVLYE